MTDYDEVFAARPQWTVALAALPKPEVFALAGRLAETHTVRPLAVSQAGLALLPLRESVQKQTFYLGELPLSTSHLEIETPDGTTVQGAALIMADDADFADALALCDGVLTHRLSGWEDVAGQVAEGLERLRHQARIRKTMLTRSRVNFSLLNEDDE
ncbi:MAG TPA: phosphonate C-P lyase system protein PhnG [Chthonomonadaceae bacterium]|nr:phosphonate C-P lyase system protein PhnG [Chthonomonadaceae bacterium]